MTPLPPEISREIQRWQQRLHWPELVPAWAEIPDASGNILWHRYEDLTVALCEQAVEYHVRQATKILSCWPTRHGTTRARTAARHIVWSRIYRCRAIFLMGTDEAATEDDMPFAYGRFEEAGAST
jgi:hypothetical protein